MGDLAELLDFLTPPSIVWNDSVGFMAKEKSKIILQRFADQWSTGGAGGIALVRTAILTLWEEATW